MRCTCLFMTDRLLPSSPKAIKHISNRPPSQSPPPSFSSSSILPSSQLSKGIKRIRRMSAPTPHHRPPSVPSTIFFLRHGARLDQHNPDWHLSSPTPYDPPLTQTGTAQARQTGAAIKDAVPQPPPTSPTMSNRRIVIHTSPFLRCVQTAVALASGLEEKVLLRVDAWLGEWLTPDYYTDIDPPPPARQLCQTAIAGLAGRTEGIGVDWGWDSLGLGGGGEYGEEWGSMHERFNGGLQQLLTYYEKESIRNNTHDTGDTALETLVILVTHGAGCNALLGALSRKPVLIDIPISSLSQAILRPSTPSSTPSQIEYELVLQASTAHVAPSPHMRSTSFPSSTTTSTHSRAASLSSSRSPIIIPDKRVLEYHPVRSRSVSSYPTFADLHQPAHHIPARHPSLHLRTSPNLFPASSTRLSSGSQSPRTGLWTPTGSVAVTESDDEDDSEGTEGRRKRAVGLWRSWASEQSGKTPDTSKERKV
jgi:broad specificity phosphatase PhoE